MAKIASRLAFLWVVGVVVPACHGGSSGDTTVGPVGAPLDPTFGTGGVTQSVPPGGFSSPTAVATDGVAMYIVGYDQTVLGDRQWRIEKRSLSTGLLDSSFGAAGVLTTNYSASDDEAKAVAVTGGSIFVAGFSNIAGNNFEWRIMKHNSTSGATEATALSNPSSRNDRALAVAVDATDLYVAGFDSQIAADKPQWRVEKFTLLALAPVGAFSAQSNASPLNDQATTIAVDATSVYVAGFDSGPSNMEWRIEKRSKATGALDITFGPGATGVVISNPSPGEDQPRALSIDATAMYIAGYDSFPGFPQWRIEKRTLSTGSLVSGFGSNGVVTSNVSTGFDAAQAMAIDATHLYAVGYSSAFLSTQWRIERRSLADGGLSYYASSDPSGGDDEATGIVLDATSLYVIGFDYSLGTVAWRTEKRTK